MRSPLDGTFKYIYTNEASGEWPVYGGVLNSGVYIHGSVDDTLIHPPFGVHVCMYIHCM